MILGASKVNFLFQSAQPDDGQFNACRPFGHGIRILTSGMNWNRLLSVVVAVIYVVIGAIEGGPVLALKVVGFSILPLACIWFPDALGSYTGLFPLGDYPITQPSPGILICIMGWVVLLMPVVIVIIASS